MTHVGQTRGKKALPAFHFIPVLRVVNVEESRVIRDMWRSGAEMRENEKMTEKGELCCGLEY